jgi:hypothetical protein
VEFPFDIVGAVEAVEKRVPFGYWLMKILLSGAVLYAILLVIRSLWLEFIWPLAKFVTVTGEVVLANFRNGNAIHLSMPDWSSSGRSVRFAVALFIFGIFTVSAFQFTRFLAAKIKALETAIDNYRSLLW